MKKGIDAYLRAVELEVDSEAIYYEGFGVVGEATTIPRVLSLLGVIKRHQAAVDLFLPIIRWCYVLIFAPLYFSFRGVYDAIKLKAKRHNRIEVYKGKELYLATSSGANLAYLPKISTLPDFIITSPFRGAISTSVLPDVPRLPVLDFVSLIDFFSAWVRALVANWCLLKVNGGRNVLWGYTAFEWFLIYGVLRRLDPKAIWVSNHHDRWLLVALSIPGAAVNLVQHGRLFHIFSSGDQISYNRKSKIRGLTAIYALDNRSEIFFSQFIDTKQVIFYKLRASLSLMPWRREGLGLLKILVIGGSNRLDFYLALMDAIRAAVLKPVALAIRHHPLQKKRLLDLRTPIEYWELSSDEPVPNPDLVVTYGSSIDDQLCSETRARLITYNWSERIDLEKIVQQVLDAIKIK